MFSSPQPLSLRVASRQVALWLHYVDLYSLRTRGQKEKCKFRQLLLWALTSLDSFNPRLHPRGDFPTSAVIYWQELFLFLRPKELPSTILNRVPHRQSNELNHHFLAPPALPRVISLPLSLSFLKMLATQIISRHFPLSLCQPETKVSHVSPALTQLGSWDHTALFHGAMVIFLR